MDHRRRVATLDKGDEAHARVREDGNKAIEFVLLAILFVMKCAPIVLHLLSWLGFVAQHRIVSRFGGTQPMHKRFDRREAAGIALLLQAWQHRLAVVQVVLLDPPVNLGLVGVQHRVALGTRHRFRLPA